MHPFRLILIAVTTGSLGGPAHSVQAFPFDHHLPHRPWMQSIRGLAPHLGIVEAGECILVRRTIVDATNRVHTRLVQVCD